MPFNRIIIQCAWWKVGTQRVRLHIHGIDKGPTGSNSNSSKSMPCIMRSNIASVCWSLTAISAHRLRTNQTHFTCHWALFADITKSRWLRGDKGVQPVYVTAASRRRRHKRVCKFNTRQIPQNAIQPLCRCNSWWILRTTNHCTYAHHYDRPNHFVWCNCKSI